MCSPTKSNVDNSKLSQSAFATHSNVQEEIPELTCSTRQSSSSSRPSSSLQSASPIPHNTILESVSYDAYLALCLVGSGLIRSIREGNHVDITYTENNEFQMIGDELAILLSKEQVLEATPDTNLISHIPSEVSMDLLHILL